MRERGPPACSGRAQSGYGGGKPPRPRTRWAGWILSRAVGESVHKDWPEDRGLPMSFLSSGVAALTGAGSGIGRALAQQLAAAGSAMAIADIDAPGPQPTLESLRGADRT